MVIWSRGNKKASTKKRLLNEMVSRAVIDEKFQINTVIEMSEDGEPAKPKVSMLSVVGDKATGIIGQAELNLCQYGLEDFNVVTLPLSKCKYEDAWIEVGLKGGEPKRSARNNESTSTTNISQDHMFAAIEDLDKMKKE
eukprot:CAMPEP_0176370870 /NCGR_PEP_ID=MMETSP0126-20121128/24304_1 /TAXON_ID=141414 ORGANISM="Strombidinopsis acuminatum, Strain SPMC142" /NCGR_SAMPLE_ID=MMETSP0126 /ASSEMBLY_ACC=CAM_ASM_000229 /LENGTH=138 /DNA_ID=CAMNT_0017730107 /DNA_START=110 /DNA_END=526 /DNA_ORIENTATION=+